MTCRSCGAAAPDLTILDGNARRVVESEAYRALAASRQALPFLRWAQLAPGEAAAEAWLHAAWTADDANHEPQATLWRREAAARWGEPVSGERLLRLVDILRRAGDFASAATLAANPAPDEASQQVLTFQRARIAAADRGRHLLSSALRPPASRPHVAHTARRTGLLSRLFGSSG